MKRRHAIKETTSIYDGAPKFRTACGQSAVRAVDVAPPGTQDGWRPIWPLVAEADEAVTCLSCLKFLKMQRDARRA